MEDAAGVDFGPLEAELARTPAPASVFELDEASHHFLRDAFTNTTIAWQALHDPRILSPDADFVLQMMTSRVAEEPAEGPSWEDYDPRLSGVLSMGLGGYAWRAAEEAAGRTTGAEIVDGIREAIGSVTLEEQLTGLHASPDASVLYQASARAIEQHVPLWLTSPGYHLWGGILYRAGKRFVTERIPSAKTVPPGDIDYAFSFGVGLHHAEQLLHVVGTPEPGEWTGSEWETCEIELRPAERTFVAVAENTDGSYIAATSERLPDMELPLPRFIDRRPLRTIRRHEQLVDELKRQGWEPIASKGSSWWSNRFRRRLADRAR